jgi:hypothetical protein
MQQEVAARSARAAFCFRQVPEKAAVGADQKRSHALEAYHLSSDPFGKVQGILGAQSSAAGAPSRGQGQQQPQQIDSTPRTKTCEVKPSESASDGKPMTVRLDGHSATMYPKEGKPIELPNTHVAGQSDNTTVHVGNQADTNKEWQIKEPTDPNQSHRGQDEAKISDEAMQPDDANDGAEDPHAALKSSMADLKRAAA